jgi:hypothetical protein
MHMLSERLQILFTLEHRKRLEEEARRRGTSVGSLVREAVNAQYGAVTRADRVRAAREIRSMSGTFLSPDELNRLVEEEREAAIRLPFGQQGD